MGYRKYAKDFEIEYVDQPGKKRQKAVRIYVGPYFRFAAEPEKIRRLRWTYLIGIAVLALLLLIPMCMDCVFTRTWFIQVPASAAWIPWLFAAAAVWRLWTAGEKVDREHYDLMHDRMSGASLFLLGFTAVSAVGCILQLSRVVPAAADLVTCACALGAVVCSLLLFSRRKELEMVQEENPEKPQAGKHKK